MVQNGIKYEIMMKARSDTLPLKWRTWGVEEEKRCPLCNHQTETLEHFLLDCDILQAIRNNCIELQRPRMEDGREEQIVSMLLLGKNGNERDNQYIEVLYQLWKERKKIIDQNQMVNNREEGDGEA